MRSYKLTNIEKLFFTKHLSMFLKSGVSLSEALNTLADEKRGNVSRTINAIIAKVENGQTLAEALSGQSRSFDVFFVSLVEIGERSGTLEKSLDFLAKKISRDQALRKKVRGMMYYPVVVVAVALAIGIFLSFFVLPKLAVMFQSFDVKLPWATRVILFLAEGIKKWGVQTILILFVLYLLLHFAITLIRPLRYFWHKYKLSLPVVGEIITYSELSTLFRNLGIMLSSGLSLEYALRVQADICKNLYVSRSVKDLHRAVSQGRSIGEELGRLQSVGIFPALCSKMIMVGEASGKLEESFSYLADFFEDESQEKTKSAAAILEPVLLVLIALVVGFVAISVIMPLYTLTGSIQG